MGLHQVLKEFGEIAVTKVSMTLTEMFWWTLRISDTEYFK